MPSPTPINRIGSGCLSWRCLAIAAITPPLAVPSSLVTMRPVKPSASSKALTWATAFCPVSRRAPAGFHAAHLARPWQWPASLLISSMRCSCVASRPAVSARTMSIPRAFAALTASNITAAGSPFCCPLFSCAITAILLRSPRPSAARARRRETCRRPQAAPFFPAAENDARACRWRWFSRRRSHPPA